MDRELEQLTKTYKAGIIDDKEFEKGKARIQERLSSVEQTAMKDEEGKKIITEILGESAELKPKKKEAKPRSAEEKHKPIEAKPKLAEKPKPEEKSKAIDEAFVVVEHEHVEEKPRPAEAKLKPKKQAKKAAKKTAKAKKRAEKDEFDEEDSTLSKVIIIAGVVCIILLLVLVKVFTGNTASPETGINMTAVNGTVEMRAYLDFTCQYSPEAWDTLIGLKEKYGDNLVVRIRYFPMSMESVVVSNAVQCAWDQGKHMEFIERIFAEEGNLSIDAMKNIAWAVGLDRNIFDACVDDHSHLEDVKNSLKEGIDSGARSSPTFYVDGQEIVGVRPIEFYQNIIDQKLGIS